MVIAAPTSAWTPYLRRTSRPANALVLVVPWLLAYHAAAAAAGFAPLNGVDLVTRAVTRAGGFTGFLVYNGVLVLLGAVLWWRTRGERRVRFGDSALLLAECAVYAAISALLIGWAVEGVAGETEAQLAIGSGAVDVLAVSAGAGVHEELLFRLVGLTGLASAVAFALAHHLAGEPLTAHAFVFRACAGLLFGVLFVTRGLAAAVYTHALYDIAALSIGG